MIGKLVVGGILVAGLVGGGAAAEWAAAQRHIEESRAAIAAANGHVSLLSQRILEATGDPEMAEIPVLTLGQLTACGEQAGMTDPTDADAIAEMARDELEALTECVAALPSDPTAGTDPMLDCTSAADTATAFACIAAALQEDE